jgi:hypothetical protein
MKCKECGRELEDTQCGRELEDTQKWINIPELGIEVEVNLHNDMNTISKIVIPTGYRLLTLSEWIVCYNKYKDSFDWGGLPDEIVSQPIEENKSKYPYWNVWFRDLDDGSVLYGNNYLNLYYNNGVRGVRFCREVKK